MARIDLDIPELGGKFTDIRDILPGDSFNWSWTRPLSQVNFLAIHHSGGPDNQTPDEIANYHINSNGWGGIGYHFIITREGEVYYVGDISSARANVANLNEQVIGICLIGNFTQGAVPTDQQFDSARSLCDFFINSYSDLSNVTSWDSVRGHKELPGQSTTCPGDSWTSWRPNIVTGVAVKEASFMQDQINNLQLSLASANQQVFVLQQRMQEKDLEISDLKDKLETSQPISNTDHSLTIIGALVNLYLFLFPPRKVE